MQSTNVEHVTFKSQGRAYTKTNENIKIPPFLILYHFTIISYPQQQLYLLNLSSCNFIFSV